MFGHRKKIEQENAPVTDTQFLEALREIALRLNSTSSQLQIFSSDLQVSIDRLKRYAASAEKKVQRNR